MILELKNISHKLDNFELKNINLSLAKGEYHVILGPSGAGKSVLLNLIAGFYSNHNGTIFLNSIDITKFTPQKRNVSILFQDLALFPHLNVFDNIAFSLKIRKFPKVQIETEVEKYLAITEISDLKYRRIQDLSGGEKQRVAIARCLISGADVLLLDEPLTAVDTQLRNSLRDLLKSIHKLGKTIIHVTHDLKETKSLADKISVIDKGQIVESGTYDAVFNHPRSVFTADFNNSKNCFRVDPKNSKIIEIGELRIYLGNVFMSDQSSYSVFFAPQDVLINDSNDDENSNVFFAEVVSVSKNGNVVQIELYAGVSIFSEMSFDSFAQRNINIGSKVKVSLDAKKIKLITN
jgi:ABC-type Fe3+/spermidine/putrescine transport system ATPase subunit